MSSSVEQFIRNIAVPPIVNVVVMGKAFDCRICVNGQGQQFPIWVSVHKLTVDGQQTPVLHAATNDMDFMVGYPPSYHDTKPVAEPDALIESISNFLCEKLANQTRVEVRLVPSVGRGQEQLPTMVGNSDDGVLGEQPEHLSI